MVLGAVERDPAAGDEHRPGLDEVARADLAELRARRDADPAVARVQRRAARPVRRGERLGRERGRPPATTSPERAERVAQVEAADDRLLVPVLAAPVVEAARLAEELHPRPAAVERMADGVDRRPLAVGEVVAPEAVGDAVPGGARHAASLAECTSATAPPRSPATRATIRAAAPSSGRGPGTSRSGRWSASSSSARSASHDARAGRRRRTAGTPSAAAPPRAPRRASVSSEMARRERRDERRSSAGRARAAHVLERRRPRREQRRARRRDRDLDVGALGEAGEHAGRSRGRRRRGPRRGAARRGPPRPGERARGRGGRRARGDPARRLGDGAAGHLDRRPGRRPPRSASLARGRRRGRSATWRGGASEAPRRPHATRSRPRPARPGCRARTRPAPRTARWRCRPGARRPPAG